MGKLITVSGRTLLQSNQSPLTLTYTITETDIKASKTFGHNKEILIKKIGLKCDCSGNYAANQTFQGSEDADIVANTNRVKCGSESILLEGDKVTIICSGIITDTNTSATSNGTASLTVTVTNTNQKNIFASKT